MLCMCGGGWWGWALDATWVAAGAAGEVANAGPADFSTYPKRKLTNRDKFLSSM